MKKLEVIIRQDQLDTVKRALVGQGIHGMTLTEVRGFGRQGGYKEVYRGKEIPVEFVPKLKIEVVVESEMVDAVVDVICDTAATGRMGDGKIFILPVDNAVRIRTREVGLDAL